MPASFLWSCIRPASRPRHAVGTSTPSQLMAGAATEASTCSTSDTTADLDPYHCGSPAACPAAAESAPVPCAQETPHMPQSTSHHDTINCCLSRPGSQTNGLSASAQQQGFGDTTISVREQSLMEAAPFATAVVSSDASEVLYHQRGSEPAAGQLLEQVLCIMGTQRPGNTHSQCDASSEAQDHAPSLLAVLVGPQAERAALKGAHDARCWRGTISVELLGRAASAGASVQVPTSSVSHGSQDLEEESATAAAAAAAGTRVPEPSKAATAAHSASESADPREPCLGAGSKHGPREFPGCTSTMGSSDVSAKQSKNSVCWRCNGADRDMEFGQVCGPLHISMINSSLFYQSGCDTEAKICDTCDSHTQASASGEQHMQHADFPSRSKSSTCLGSAFNRRNSLVLSETDIQTLETGFRSNESSTRTRALLRALTQSLSRYEAQDLEQGTETPTLVTPSKPTATTQPGCTTQPATGDSNPVITLPAADSKRQHPTVATRCTAGHAPVGAMPDAVQERCFDITVSVLRPSKGNRSPLLVIISDCTQTSQVRAALSALAESQLALLSSMMPQHAIQFLAMESKEAVPENVGQLARAHKDVTLMFMDICGFTSMCEEITPQEVMIFLNMLFSVFDQLTDVYGVHKVETAGDCYIVSGGIMSPEQATDGFGLAVDEDPDPAKSANRVMGFAKALLEEARKINMPGTKEAVRVRVGIHTGDVVSGLIGCKLPKFSLFGDTMNMASRMESTGVPGRIHVSETTYKLLPHENWEPTGGVVVKGKGLMLTYLWSPQENQTSGRLLLPEHSPESSGTLPSGLLKSTQTLLRELNSSVPIPIRFPPTHSYGGQGCD